MKIGTATEIVMYLMDESESYPDRVYELKVYRRKRSLDANAYYWVLVTKIADVLRTSKIDVHMEMLRNYSQVTAVCIPREASLEGLVKYYELDGIIERGGREYKVFKVYKPSSEMNSKEMSVLIDGTISEAKDLGIETLPPDELKSMLEEWHKKTNEGITD